MTYNELAQQKANEYKTPAGPFDLMVDSEHYDFIRDIIAQKIYRFIAGRETQQEDCIKDIQGYLRCLKQYCYGVGFYFEKTSKKRAKNLIRENKFETYNDFKQVAVLLMEYFYSEEEQTLIEWEKNEVFIELMERMEGAEFILYDIMGLTW